VRIPDNDLIDVYARLDACPTDMPNTPRLLAEEARHRELAMTAVLIDERHEAALREAFPSFRVFGGAWDRPLARLRGYDAPWVLSFTPPKVSGNHLSRLGEHVRVALHPARHPGIVCVLGRNLHDSGRESFWDAMVDGFEAHEIEFVAVQAPKNRRHVMGMACADGGLVAEAALAAHDFLETVAVV